MKTRILRLRLARFPCWLVGHALQTRGSRFSAVNDLTGTYDILNNDSVKLYLVGTMIYINHDSIMKWDDVYLDVDHGNLKYKMDIAGIKLSLTANNKNEYIFRAEGY